MSTASVQTFQTEPQHLIDLLHDQRALYYHHRLFVDLRRGWWAAAKGKSLLSDIVWQHPCYLALRDLGDLIVPFIIQEFRTTTDTPQPLVALLEKALNMDPFTGSGYGDARIQYGNWARSSAGTFLEYKGWSRIIDACGVRDPNQLRRHPAYSEILLRSGADGTEAQMRPIIVRELTDRLQIDGTDPSPGLYWRWALLWALQYDPSRYAQKTWEECTKAEMEQLLLCG